MQNDHPSSSQNPFSQPVANGSSNVLQQQLFAQLQQQMHYNALSQLRDQLQAQERLMTTLMASRPGFITQFNQPFSPSQPNFYGLLGDPLQGYSSPSIFLPYPASQPVTNPSESSPTQNGPISPSTTSTTTKDKNSVDGDKKRSVTPTRSKVEEERSEWTPNNKERRHRLHKSPRQQDNKEASPVVTGRVEKSHITRRSPRIGACVHGISPHARCPQYGCGGCKHNKFKWNCHKCNLCSHGVFKRMCDTCRS